MNDEIEALTAPRVVSAAKLWVRYTSDSDDMPAESEFVLDWAVGRDEPY